MNCELCLRDPTTHSFKLVKREGDVDVFYTAPALATVKQRGFERFDGFKAHLPKGQWRWIFDCSGCSFTEFLDIGFVSALASELDNFHRDLLVEVWIVSPQWWLASALGIIKRVSSSDLVNKCSVKDRSVLG